MSAPHLSVIIPAYNEEMRLPPYLGEVSAYMRTRGLPYEVIVVDDGSHDGTSLVVQELMKSDPCLQLVRLRTNRGKGAAVRTGMLAARGLLRLFADADGATPIAEVERLEEAVRQGAHIAVASRALPDATRIVKGTLFRKVLGTIFNLLVQVMAVPGIRDTQCGFKLFTARAAETTFGLQTIDDFGFDVEVLFIARKRGLSIVEVPVNWIDVAGTKVRVGRDALKMLLDVARVRMNEIRGDYRKDGRIEA